MAHPAVDGRSHAAPGPERAPGPRGPVGRLVGREHRRRHAVPQGPEPGRLSGRRASHPGAVGGRRHLRGLGRRPSRCAPIRVQRRAAVRQRPPPLRPPAHRLRQGRGAPLPDHAGQPGGAPVRVGLPRPAGGDGRREGAGHRRPQGHQRVRHRQLQRLLPHLGAPLHRRVGALRQPTGALGRLRRRLQDHGPPLHGERHVGLQAALGQGADLPGLPGGGPRPRCPTSRSASTTPPGPARTPPSPWPSTWTRSRAIRHR